VQAVEPSTSYRIEQEGKVQTDGHLKVLYANADITMANYPGLSEILLESLELPERSLTSLFLQRNEHSIYKNLV
jgi:hypothetical protein